MDNYPVNVDEPFPSLVDVRPDKKTVEILKKLAYSNISEMNAVCTYLYQYVTFDPSYMDIAKTLERISIVEMTHLEALSHAIVAFSGEADYKYDGKYYSTSQVDFTDDIIEAIKHDIIAEQQAIRDYQDAIKRLDNTSLKMLIERIIKDEELHIDIYNAILNTLDI